MITDEQKELQELRRRVLELETMKETAKLVSIVQDENQKMFSKLLKMKEQQDYAYSLINTIQVLEKDKQTISLIKTLLKP